MTIILRKTLG